MIEVIIHYENDNISSFTLSGHANSGPYGYDLVCAGVSAISFGAINAVFELSDVKLHVAQGEDGGFLEVVVPKHISEEEREKVNLIFNAMIISLQTIESSYREHIFIKKQKGG